MVLTLSFPEATESYCALLSSNEQKSSWQGVPDFLYEVVPAKQLLQIVLTWTNG